ncbi:glycosyltransferase family 69 protein [Calocera cornea HHB12733]|uniref:Glycosyltransferase family 69 protein n=1 Tax=Calocera cornea HHB12733 TaxID=1353952 RepID=A0A165EJL3_9BASI|nr:glycosyltransferase family 69 protein [Calocera cornea HHB12733]
MYTRRASLSVAPIKDHPPASPLAYLVQAYRRIPPPLVLLLGVTIGLLVARIIFPASTPSDASQWSGGSGATKLRADHRPAGRRSVQMPTFEQRRRVLELLTHLAPHHTRECMRDSQPQYVHQAHQRYAPLIGHAPPPRRAFPWSEPEPIEIQKQRRRAEVASRQHKYFFAINLYNSFDVIPDIFSTMFRLGAILGYHNVFVSIYENGSKDQTKALLRIFDALTRSVGMRVVIRTSQRTRGQFNHRIEYLAEVRNSALVPLHEQRDNEGEVFDSVVFMNDILPCVDDLLELIYQSRHQNAGLTCAADYMFHDELNTPVFYDNWVARDINGTALENAPFEHVFHHPESARRFQVHLPVQVQSCWNGVAILDPAPLYGAPHVRFRMAKLSQGECSASECSLIGNDYWNAGYGRIIMVPRVKLAYDKKVYDIIHPKRQNLTAIRNYVRIGGLADDPRADPQDRTWFGPHDRLFIEEESEKIEFKPGPEYALS